MRNIKAKYIALCGILAALACVIMFLGGLIPFATYACPILCTLTGNLVLILCGKRYCWTWYFSVSVLVLILGPDREASVLFVFLGAYPCIRIYLERLRLRIVWKLAYFNLATLFATWISAYVLGLADIIDEITAGGTGVLLVIAVLSNITFSLLDLLMFRMSKIIKDKRRQ